MKAIAVIVMVLLSTAVLAETADVLVNGQPVEATLQVDAPTGAVVAGIDVGDTDIETDRVRVNTPGALVAVDDSDVGDVEIDVGNRTTIRTPGVVVTPGEVRLTPALIKANIERDNVDLDSLLQELEGQDVEITPGLIKAGNVSVTTAGKTLSVTVDGSTIKIDTGTTQVTLTDGDLKVTAPGVKIEKGKVKVDGVEIKTPKQAISVDVQAKATGVTIVKEDDRPVYKVKTKENKRLLWLFPVTADGETTIDAQVGTTISVKGPWWSFLAS